MPVDVGREEAQRLATEELSRQVYAASRPSLLSRALSWLGEQLQKLLPDSAAGLLGSPAGQAVVVALLVLVLAFALRLTSQAVTRRRRTAPAAVFAEDAGLSAADHRARADDHAADGRWPQAVAERFRAVVRSAEERALLDERPGRTAAETAAEIAAEVPDVAADLRAGARTFDDVVYGSASGSADDDARLRALDARLQTSRPALAGSSARGGFSEDEPGSGERTGTP